MSQTFKIDSSSVKSGEYALNLSQEIEFYFSNELNPSSYEQDLEMYYTPYDSVQIKNTYLKDSNRTLVIELALKYDVDYSLFITRIRDINDVLMTSNPYGINFSTSDLAAEVDIFGTANYDELEEQGDIILFMESNPLSSPKQVSNKTTFGSTVDNDSSKFGPIKIRSGTYWPILINPYIQTINNSKKFAILDENNDNQPDSIVINEDLLNLDLNFRLIEIPYTLFSEIQDVNILASTFINEDNLKPIHAVGTERLISNQENYLLGNPLYQITNPDGKDTYWNYVYYSELQDKYFVFTSSLSDSPYLEVDLEFYELIPDSISALELQTINDTSLIDSDVVIQIAENNGGKEFRDQIEFPQNSSINYSLFNNFWAFDTLENESPLWNIEYNLRYQDKGNIQVYTKKEFFIDAVNGNLITTKNYTDKPSNSSKFLSAVIDSALERSLDNELYFVNTSNFISHSKVFINNFSSRIEKDIDASDGLFSAYEFIFNSSSNNNQTIAFSDRTGQIGTTVSASLDFYSSLDYEGIISIDTSKIIDSEIAFNIADSLGGKAFRLNTNYISTDNEFVCSIEPSTGLQITGGHLYWEFEELEKTNIPLLWHIKYTKLDSNGSLNELSFFIDMKTGDLFKKRSTNYSEDKPLTLFDAYNIVIDSVLSIDSTNTFEFAHSLNDFSCEFQHNHDNNSSAQKYFGVPNFSTNQEMLPNGYNTSWNLYFRRGSSNNLFNDFIEVTVNSDSSYTIDYSSSEFDLGRFNDTNVNIDLESTIDSDSSISLINNNGLIDFLSTSNNPDLKSISFQLLSGDIGWLFPENYSYPEKNVLSLKVIRSFKNEFNSINSVSYSDTSFFLLDQSTGEFLGDKIPTDINETATDLPKNHKIFQNFPNPFNPSTNINFSLYNSSTVTIKVYNLLGQEVAVLSNKKLFTSGNHTLIFDASNLSSGTYFYSVQIGHEVWVKTMTLIK